MRSGIILEISVMVMTNNYSDYLKFTAELAIISIQRALILALNTKNPIVNESAFKNNFSKWPSYLDQTI
jgi:hypothetical protein